MKSRCISSECSLAEKVEQCRARRGCSKFWFAASLLCVLFLAGLVVQLDFSFYRRRNAGNDGIHLIPKRIIMEIKSGGNEAIEND